MKLLRPAVLMLVLAMSLRAAELPLVTLDNAQPLAANVARLVQTLSLLGAPLESNIVADLTAASDGEPIQRLLDGRVAFGVTINPESRVKAQRGPVGVALQQAGFTPVLVKIINQSSVTKELRIVSPQAGQVYAGMTELSAERMQRKQLKETIQKEAATNRFLEIAMHTA